MPSQNEIRQTITSQIVEALKSGTLPPWRRPWALDKNAGHPANVVSKRSYRGINPLILGVASARHGFRSKWWATFNQWKQLGGTVMKRPDDVPPGKWGTAIIYWQRLTKTVRDDNGEDEEQRFFFCKMYTVFNVDQVVGDHLDHLRVGNAPLDTMEVQARYEKADEAIAAIAATGADIRHGGNRAYYEPQGDYIAMPHRHQFTDGEYYETVFHELTHHSEAPSRLNCDRSKPENSYAFLELRAELGGCYVAAELGLPTAENLTNHASYLQSWLQQMENDPKFVWRAAAQASQAADFILSFSRQPVEEEEPVLA
jgi:antirestriction protein ArdC